MPEESANTLQLLEHAARRGWLLDQRKMPCPRRQLPASYDELLRVTAKPDADFDPVGAA